MTMNKKDLRLDVDNAFVSTQLEYVRAAALAPPLVPLKGRQLIPTNNEVPEGAESFTYRQYDLLGKADWIGDKADDLPSVNSTSSETTIKPYTFGTSYEFSRQELLAAQYANVPLDARKASAARRAIELFFDTIAQSGNAAHGLKGLMNQSGTCTYTVPADGSGASKLWNTKTGDLILRDMHGIAQQIVSDTYEVEQPDTLVLPTTAFALIATTPFSDYTEDSILNIFLRTSRYITTVVPWTAADAAGGSGEGRMLAYRRSNEVLEHVIPAEFVQLPMESRKSGLEFFTACLGRTAGVCVYRPKALCVGDGVTAAP
jgi:hypothetical protein